MEQVGKQILKHSTRPGFDAITFFETALFCFLTGNADMHLKNFALLTTHKNEVTLSPAFDLLCTKIAMPDDNEESALTINGRKRKLKRADFDALAKSLNISEKSKMNSFEKFASKMKDVNKLIDASFLPRSQKNEYKRLSAVTTRRFQI